MAKFWVGGTGNWNDPTNHWATISGGSPGAGNTPTSSDDVVFDTLSNATAYTVTVNAAANTASLTIGNPATGAVTFAGSSTLAVFANLSVAASVLYTYTGSLSFRGTSGTNTITTNSVQITSPFIFNGVGGTFQLADNLNLTGKSLTLTNGTFDSNGKSVTCSSFLSNNSNTRVLTMGASVWNLTSDFNVSVTGSGLTVTGGLTSSITITGNGIFTGGGATYYDLTMIPQGNAVTINAANTFHNLTLTGGANLTEDISLSGNQTVSNSFTIAGNSAVNRIFLYSTLTATARTITAASATLSNTDFMDITGAGTATWSGSALGNCGGNTNFTFTTPVTRYWVATAGGNYAATTSWSTGSGGASGASVPLPQDSVIIDGSSVVGAGRSLTFDFPRVGGFNTTGVTNTPAIVMNSASGTVSIFGSVTLSGITDGSSSIWALAGRSSYQFDSGAIILISAVKLVAPSGTYTVTNNDFATTNTSGLTVLNGTFASINKNVTVKTVSSNSSAVRSISGGTGTWTLNSDTGNVWNLGGSNLTILATFTVFVINDTGATSKSFLGAGFTYGTLTVTGDNVIITGSSTFTNLNVNNAGLTTGLKLTAGTTQTVTNFSTNGSLGNLAKLISTSAGTPATMTTASSRISVDYMSIKDSTVTPANTWYAGSHSTNVSGNSGWIFTDAPSSAAPSAMLMGVG